MSWISVSSKSRLGTTMNGAIHAESATWSRFWPGKPRLTDDRVGDDRADFRQFRLTHLISISQFRELSGGAPDEFAQENDRRRATSWQAGHHPRRFQRPAR